MTLFGLVELFGAGEDAGAYVIGIFFHGIVDMFLHLAKALYEFGNAIEQTEHIFCHENLAVALR